MPTIQLYQKEHTAMPIYIHPVFLSIWDHSTFNSCWLIWFHTSHQKDNYIIDAKLLTNAYSSDNVNKNHSTVPSAAAWTHTALFSAIGVKILKYFGKACIATYLTKKSIFATKFNNWVDHFLIKGRFANASSLWCTVYKGNMLFWSNLQLQQ